MTSRDRHECEWVAAHVDAFLEEELDTVDRHRLEAHTRACADCRAELEFARQLVSELRALPQLDCPDHVVSAAERAISTRPRGAWERLRAAVDAHLAGLMRPAMAVIVIMVVAVGVFVLVHHDRAVNGHSRVAGSADTNATQVTLENVSEEELQMAARDAMIAFAYVNKYTRRTGQIVKAEVGGRVAGSVRKAMAKAIVEASPFGDDSKEAGQ